MKMTTIVITGGPCAGKTSVMEAIEKKFNDQVVFVPEAATLLLSGGFPQPGRDCPWSLEWQYSFQRAIVTIQQSMEDACRIKAVAKGADVLVCDRGLMDGAAYTPGGVAEFCRIFELDTVQVLGRYHAVIHLESLATSHPELYGRGNNEHRFESLEEAQKLEGTTYDAWRLHNHHFFAEGTPKPEEKIAHVLEIFEALLALPDREE